VSNPDQRARGPALVLALLLAALPALAQAPAGGAVAEEEPGEPAATAPSPADLSRAPLPSLPAEVADLPLTPDIARLPIGGWRFGGRAGRGETDPAARLAIETIGRYLAERTTGRVTVIAEVSGPSDDPSVARRTSLARAIAVKNALVNGGLAGTRIDLRPMGRTGEGRDALDILAPPRPPERQAGPAPNPAPGPSASPAPPGPTTAPRRP